jgi:hypothetical protein
MVSFETVSPNIPLAVSTPKDIAGVSRSIKFRENVMFSLELLAPEYGHDSRERGKPFENLFTNPGIGLIGKLGGEYCAPYGSSAVQ